LTDNADCDIVGLVSKQKPLYRVVLWNWAETRARASGTVFGILGASQLALEYWDAAEKGDKVCVYVGVEKRGMADFAWIKGMSDIGAIYRQLKGV
jgi:hypothetical protein